MFLMPSRYEPCGLNQIYSLKYGTVPIVRATGGLDDTIESWDATSGKGTGFKFTEYNGESLLLTIKQSLQAFRDQTSWQVLMRNGMNKDFSWNASAREYGKVYERVRQARGAAPAVTDLLGGQIDLFFATPQSVVQLVATGKLKAYGVTAKEKLPELPTAESLPAMFGPKLDVVYWQAMFAPSGTPEPVIKTLNEAAQTAVSDPTNLKTWAAQDVSVFPPDQRSPAAASAFLASEIARWGQVIRDNNIHLEQ